MFVKKSHRSKFQMSLKFVDNWINKVNSRLKNEPFFVYGLYFVSVYRCLAVQQLVSKFCAPCWAVRKQLSVCEVWNARVCCAESLWKPELSTPHGSVCRSSFSGPSHSGTVLWHAYVSFPVFRRNCMHCRPWKRGINWPSLFQCGLRIVVSPQFFLCIN